MCTGGAAPTSAGLAATISLSLLRFGQSFWPCVKVVAKTRREAPQAANNLLKQGMVIVTVIGDGRVYTMEEFALTVVNERD
jgi:hypothetical protein